MLLNRSISRSLLLLNRSLSRSLLTLTPLRRVPTIRVCGEYLALPWGRFPNAISRGRVLDAVPV